MKRPAAKRVNVVVVGLAAVMLLVAVYILVAMVFVRVQHVDRPQSSSSSTTAIEHHKPALMMRKNYVQCDTSKGPFTVQLDWEASPNSAAQFVKMVDAGYFDRIAFFRVNKDITQFGVRERHTGKKMDLDWERDLNPEQDREKRLPWKRGVLALIGGPQMIIVKRDSKVMGKNNHDTVAGWIDEEGMKTIDKLYAYNDVIDNPKGGGPDQTKVYSEGWTYLNREYPLVDYILGCV